ncbi:hypothetical protein LOTGIDRAFT_169666 [Lottia gigantea]|uniref:5'-Nucleotidase C-terminal domain-containing protein n=1 Tax=Lottia gigantea TaxID=225164 RepID=V3ZFY0_LOTGI|nr:hypothetical protein LOTGIDRAFT_169666 [Lottia gigantea]ESO83037.1 hypothetical protein LOTGIDRAFT_169666 [Lottia gigantea]
MASFSMIHFNDVYNIEADLIEPLGGAARLAGYIKSCAEEDPVVFFSGDALSPSLISIFLKGEQMIPVMNGVGVTCAVLGNHDFDFGVDHLEDLMAQTKFPWLLSNVIDDFTNEPLAYAGISQIIVSKGLMGLVEEEWIDTLATIDPEDVIFKDYVESGREIAHSLRTQGADIVIALTHMRWPNDIRLAEEVEDLDIILGGHDHDYCVEMINGTYIVKSGTDFRNLSHIHVTKDENGKWKFDIKEVELDSSVKEDPEIKELVTAKLAQVDDKMDNKLGDILVDLDGRFAKIRTQETNLGNFVTDIILTATCADMTILNSGTFRSDRIHPRGDFIIRDLLTILPLLDHMLIIECTGKQIVQALENGVSQYPKLEGRFPQVAGCRFGFDPSKAKGHRIDPALVLIQDEYVDLEKKYRLCTKEYLAHGKDGYTVLKDCPILVNVENCPTLSTCIQNHFESVQMLYGEKECRSGHRQSLLCLVKKEEIIVKRQESSDSINRALVRQQSIHDAEIEKPHLAPEIDGRIFQYDDEKHMELLALKDSQSKKRLDVGRKEETTSRLDVGRKEETTSRLDVGRKEETTSRLDVGRKEETTSRLDFYVHKQLSL